jgi:ABC transporter, phosphonate, periplasmic substrate-binding protein
MLLALMFSLAMNADAQNLRMLVHLSGGPGDTQAANKPLKNFLSLWEKEAGLPMGSLEGKYFPQKEAALEYAKSDAPSLFMLPVATFLEHEKSWGLEPICEVSLKGSPVENLYVVVKKDAVANVAALKGKTVVSSLMSDMKMGDLVELEDGTRLAQHTTLSYERSPLSALRQVREGGAAAVLLDESQWTGLEKLPYAAELTLLARAKPLPRPIIAVSKKVGKATQDKLQKGLLAVGKNPEATSTLQQFSVDGIAPVDATALAAARKRVQKK